MTAATVSQKKEGFLGGIIVFVLLAVGFGLMLSRAGEVEESDGVVLEYGAHAESHGYEADAARGCFAIHGTAAVFKQDNRFARLCIFPDGWVALQILVTIGDKYYEVSSYVPHLLDNTFRGVVNWLVNECGWTAFNGPVPVP